MSKKCKVAAVMLAIIAVVCFSYVGYFIFNQYYKPLQDEKKVDEVREIYSMIPENEEDDSPEVKFEYDDYGQLVKTTQEAAENPVSENTPLDKVREIYGDTVAWIYIPGTTVDYPVVRGNDNSYYLNHDHKGQYTANGAIFMDRNCNSDSQNVIIYGHHMNANIMFTDLMKMKNREFGLEHKTLYLDLNDGSTTEWTLLAAFACSDVSAESFTRSSFNSDSVGDWVDRIKNMRYYDTGVDFGETDQYVTMITCSYERNDYRTVVIAKRGE